MSPPALTAIPRVARRSDRSLSHDDDRDKVSSFFQVQAKVPPNDDENIDREIEPNSDDLNELGNWLGGRDSNPDNVVQRAANGLRFVPVRAVSFQCSALSVRFVTLRFGLFTHKMSQTVSRLDQSDASGDSYGILGN